MKIINKDFSKIRLMHLLSDIGVDAIIAGSTALLFNDIYKRKDKCVDQIELMMLKDDFDKAIKNKVICLNYGNRSNRYEYRCNYRFENCKKLKVIVHIIDSIPKMKYNILNNGIIDIKVLKQDYAINTEIKKAIKCMDIGDLEYYDSIKKTNYAEIAKKVIDRNNERKKKIKPSGSLYDLISSRGDVQLTPNGNISVNVDDFSADNLSEMGF